MVHLLEGAKTGLKCIEQLKKKYQANGISYNRPWMILISDGEPNDYGSELLMIAGKQKIKNKVTIFPIGVKGRICKFYQNFQINQQ